MFVFEFQQGCDCRDTGHTAFLDRGLCLSFELVQRPKCVKLRNLPNKSTNHPQTLTFALRVRLATDIIFRHAPHKGCESAGRTTQRWQVARIDS